MAKSSENKDCFRDSKFAIILFFFCTMLPQNLCLFSSTAFGDEPDPVEEVQKDQQQMQEQFKGFNNANPLSTDFNNTPNAKLTEAQAQMAKLLEMQKNTTEGIQPLLKYPIVQKLAQVTRDPRFMERLQLLIKHPALVQLGYYQLGWVALFFVLRLLIKWKLTLSGILTRILASLLMTGSYLVISIYVIPTVLFGPVFTDLVQMIVDGLSK